MAVHNLDGSCIRSLRRLLSSFPAVAREQGEDASLAPLIVEERAPDYVVRETGCNSRERFLLSLFENRGRDRKNVARADRL